jgi:hypothetical protein
LPGEIAEQHGEPVFSRLPLTILQVETAVASDLDEALVHKFLDCAGS